MDSAALCGFPLIDQPLSHGFCDADKQRPLGTRRTVGYGYALFTLAVVQAVPLAAIAADENNDMIYLSDPDTYELLYLNRSARETLGIAPDAQLCGLKCHKVIENKDAPCKFCLNDLLSGCEKVI